MFYAPKPNKKGWLTSLSLILMSVVVSSMSQTVKFGGGIFNVASAVLLTAALFISVRYVISNYVYEITSDSFAVTKITGRRKTVVASLSLSEAIGISKRPKTKDERADFHSRFGKTDARMNFCRNLFADSYVLVSNFNGKKYEILLEVNAQFAHMIESAVSSARAARDEYGEN